MEREPQIIEAKRTLHRLLSLPGKPHTRHIRMHRQALEDNLNRIRALDGICGRCKNLKLRFGRVDGKDVVAVLCRRQYMPMKIYENILMGQEASCYGFEKVSQ